MAKEMREREYARLGERESRGGFFLSVLFAFLLMLLAAGGVLLLGALVLTRLPDATPYIRTVGCALGGLIALIGGIVAGRRQKHASALAGLLYGVFYVLLLIFCGRFLHGDTPLWYQALGYAILLLLSVLGGALAKARRSGHRRRRIRA